MTTNQSGAGDSAGERRYRHLFEHLPICIFVADTTVVPARIVEANGRAVQVFGYTAAEMAGMPAAQLVFDDARPGVLVFFHRVQQGEKVTGESVCLHRDGTAFPVRVILASDPADDARVIVAVEDITAESQRRSEAEAIDAERRRIAHEIHDGVAQTLAGLRFKSALWSQLPDATPPRMRDALDELQAVLADAVIDLRRAIFALRPVDLDTLGFFPALTQLVCDFGDHYRLAAKFESSGPQAALPVCYELPLFRVIQESLNNIGQHANSSWMYVCIEIRAGGAVALSVRDNGSGFDATHLRASQEGERFGLRQMRERVVELEGTLDIHSVIGEGTELRITLPTPAPKVNRAPYK